MHHKDVRKTYGLREIRGQSQKGRKMKVGQSKAAINANNKLNKGFIF